MAKKVTKSVKMYDGDDKSFKDACAKADIQPFARQYRKWCQNRGLAWQNRNKE